jgi:hypothetical protein
LKEPELRSIVQMVGEVVRVFVTEPMEHPVPSPRAEPMPADRRSPRC